MPPDGMILIRSAPRFLWSRTWRRAESGPSTIELAHAGSDRAGSKPLDGSLCPPVGPNGSSDTHRRGPETLPSSMACLSATVSSPPPTSRALVKPCSSMARLKAAASKARSRLVWVTASSTALARLGSLADTWTWQSMKPGITVSRLRSMTWAPPREM